MPAGTAGAAGAALTWSVRDDAEARRALADLRRDCLRAIPWGLAIGAVESFLLALILPGGVLTPMDVLVAALPVPLGLALVTSLPLPFPAQRHELTAEGCRVGGRLRLRWARARGWGWLETEPARLLLLGRGGNLLRLRAPDPGMRPQVEALLDRFIPRLSPEAARPYGQEVELRDGELALLLLLSFACALTAAVLAAPLILQGRLWAGLGVVNLACVPPGVLAWRVPRTRYPHLGHAWAALGVVAWLLTVLLAEPLVMARVLRALFGAWL